MMSAKSKNMSFNTSASRMTLVTIKILMVILLGLSLSVFAAPLSWEPEWSAIVVPITHSQATAKEGRLMGQSKHLPWGNDMSTATRTKPVGTVTEAPYLYSTCRGFSCRDMNRSNNRDVEDRRDKDRLSQNHQEPKRCGNNHNEKKRCGGKNQQNKPCGKNQHQKHCGKNQCEKCRGKNQGKKDCGEKRRCKNQCKEHCGEKRNGQSRHDTTNCNRQNKRKNNMKNGNKRGPLVVDNKVFVNVNDGRTPGPTLLPRIETTVAQTRQASIVPQSVGHCDCTRFWHSDVKWLSLLAICIAIIFCIYKVYFISDRYHSIIY